MSKIRIAHLAGPTATIQNTPPLVTSNKARLRSGLPPMAGAKDALRPQRLAAPVTVYVEQFSAHPLEADAAELYGPPDGYIGSDGVFSRERRDAADRAVYEIELTPEDGLYPLPYVALQTDGTPWEEECAQPGGTLYRQGFFPDGARSFEEIDRLSIGADGRVNLIGDRAEVDFYRVAPPGGYTKAEPAERHGLDFFAYKPFHLAKQPPRPFLAKITNDVQAIMASGRYDGAIWTQGSPQVEEIAYWFNLLIDTDRPIACNAAQRPHGQISNDGPANIVDSVTYIHSRIWADEAGHNRAGTVVIQEQQFFAAREVAKVDARPGGYVATGGHGGILGQVTHAGVPYLMYVPAYRHTAGSAVNITRLPETVRAAKMTASGVSTTELRIKAADGTLLPDAIPSVSIVKDGGFAAEAFGEDPLADIDARLDRSSAAWQEWARNLTVDGPYAGAMRRSALALKLLLFSPSGATAAAATNSLPERLGGDKNYDYRYAWVRDVAYTIKAFLRVGATEEAKAAFSWLIGTIRRHGMPLRTLYRLDGGEAPDEASLDLPGHRDSRPVLLGNKARDQLQLGIFGDVLETASLFVDNGHVLDLLTRRLLGELVDRCADLWMLKDAGIWELEAVEHYTMSKIGCWTALDRAVRLAEKHQIDTQHADRWRRERDRIRDWVDANCWSDAKQSYTLHPGTDRLDAALLLATRFGFERRDRLAATRDAVVRELADGPLVYRYSGMEAEEGSFTACGFWLVEAFALLGDAASARRQMDGMLERCGGNLGLLTEQVDPKTGEMLGNLPQALSHLALIHAAIAIGEAESC